MIKIPRIQQRPINDSVFQAAKTLGLTKLQAKLIASRTESTADLEKIAFPKLKHIQHPSALKNVKKAAQLIVKAINSEGVIVLACYSYYW